MQISSIDSTSPNSSVSASSDTKTSLPIGNVANIDARPQVAFLMPDIAVASTSQGGILHQSLAVERTQKNLLQESEEIQFTSILKNLSKLDDLYYDEDLLKSLIRSDDPRKYSYQELFTSALRAQAAWYRVKNRVLDLMHFIPLKKNRNIISGKMGLSVAITNLINNKIKHQTCLDRIKAKNFDDINSTTRQKTNKELDHEMRRARGFLTGHRREYFYSLTHHGMEDSVITENLSQYFLNEYSCQAIKNIFMSLSEEKIAELVQYHLSSLSSSSFSISVDKMEEHVFKIQRKPVPKSFWYSLGKSSGKNWKAFNQHFFLFLLSSWISEPEYLFLQKLELKSAGKTNNVHEVLKISADKLLQLSLRTGAQKVLNQILIFAKEYESLISKDSDFTQRALAYARKESALAKLNEAYFYAFAKTFLPYIEGKKIDWSLKTLEECQAQVNILNCKIYNANVTKKQLSDKERLDAKRFLDFIYAVLLHFRDNYSIQLTNLNDIAARTIQAAQQIQKTEEQLQSSTQSLKRKRKENRQSEQLQTSVLEKTIQLAKIKKEEEKQIEDTLGGTIPLFRIKQEENQYEQPQIDILEDNIQLVSVKQEECAQDEMPKVSVSEETIQWVKIKQEEYLQNEQPCNSRISFIAERNFQISPVKDEESENSVN